MREATRPSHTRRSFHQWSSIYLAIGSLAGLLVGLVIGLIGDGSVGGIESMLQGARPYVRLWVRTLMYFAGFLAAAYVLRAVLSARERKNVGKLAGAAATQHLLFVALTGAVSITAGQIFGLLPELSAESVLSGLDLPDGPAEARPPTLAERFGMMFENPLTAVLRPNVLAIVVWSVVLGLVMSFLPQRFRSRTVAACATAARLLFTGIVLVLLLMPFVMVYVAYGMAASLGPMLLTSLGVWFFGMCMLLILYVGALFIAVRTVGRTGIRDFISGMAPVYAVAVGSRSSLVCLPALIESAKDRLGLPQPIYELILPLVNTTMKGSTAATHPFSLFFLSWLYGVHLDVLIVAVFMLGIVQVSFVAPGLPSGAAMFGLPLFLAAGIPVEGYLLLKAFDYIPDILKTILNVSEDMTIAVITSKFT